MLLSVASSIFGSANDPRLGDDGVEKPTTYSWESASDMTLDDLGRSRDDELSLTLRYPSLSAEDCARFKKNFASDDGNEDDVIKNLDEYVQFRAMYELDSQQQQQQQQQQQVTEDIDEDQADWAWASEMAIDAAKNCKDDLIPGLKASTFENRICEINELPQLCFSYKDNDGTPVVSKNGNPMIQFLSARLDLNAVSPEIHALCIALYLERKAQNPHFTKEGVVLLADVRQGSGWPNHHVLSAVGFLKILASTLLKIHPGRMKKLVIYPVPCACVYVFQMMQAFLPTAISDNISLIYGSDGILDPVPEEEMSELVHTDILRKMEDTRTSSFVK